MDTNFGLMTPSQWEAWRAEARREAPKWFNRFKQGDETMDTPGYESLAGVLQRAYFQASDGKGAERHACNRPFTEQPMQSISALLGNETGLLYQAMKKIQESQRLDQDAAIRELLGAINYIAGAIIFKESKQGSLGLAAARGSQATSSIAAAANQSGQASLNKKASGSTSHWLCYHGQRDVPGQSVPIGEACPTCYAASN